MREGERARESPRERADPCLDRLLLLFWHITLRMILIYYAQVPFRQLQKTKERVLLITSKTRMLQLKGETRHTPHLGGLAQTLGS